MKEYHFIDAAKRMAEKSSFKVQMGAVVAWRRRIVGHGFNYAHSSGQEHGDGEHAEIAALNATTARYRNGCSVYVCRISNDTLKLAKPCDACETVMRKMGVKYVWYSTGRDNEWVKMEL